MIKKIGNFELEKYDFYGDFWCSKFPMENIREDSEPYCSLEKDSMGKWNLNIMGGIWCETCEFTSYGSFNDCIKRARNFLVSS